MRCYYVVQGDPSLEIEIPPEDLEYWVTGHDFKPTDTSNILKCDCGLTVQVGNHMDGKGKIITLIDLSVCFKKPMWMHGQLECALSPEDKLVKELLE